MESQSVTPQPADQPVTATPRRERVRTIQTRKRLAIAKLLGEGELNQGEIAALVGVSRMTVNRLNGTLAKRTGIDDLDTRLEMYRQKVIKTVPDEFKASKLRSVIDRDASNPFAALRAIQYCDTLLGYVRQADNDARQPIPQPLFSLPAGSVIRIGAGAQNCDVRSEVTTSQTPGNVIDITPNKPDSTDNT